MQSKAATVQQYLAELPPDRRAAIEAVRNVILKNIDKAYQEGMGYGNMGWVVPHSIFPAGYHCDPRLPLPFAGLASQKNYMSLYLMCVGNDAHASWLRDQFAKAGKKLDMGKCCIRFKKLDDLPLDVIGEAIRRVPAKTYVNWYVRSLKQIGKVSSTRPAAKKPGGKKLAAKPASTAKRATPKAKPSRAKAANKKSASRRA